MVDALAGHGGTISDRISASTGQYWTKAPLAEPLSFHICPAGMPLIGTSAELDSASIGMIVAGYLRSTTGWYGLALCQGANTASGNVFNSSERWSVAEGVTSVSSRPVVEERSPSCSADAVQASEAMVHWLYKESGLTWDQLARMLGVSRRSIHAWAGGQRISGRNLERLSSVYRVISEISASSPSERRQSIFEPRPGSANIFDQLVSAARKPGQPAGVALAERLGIAN
ncbi:helix-turn-helix transcriptional regulator [Mycolicibacterium sp. 018/SC-01/001]|uniref:helix-turn-helix domain-containing protein n=1 Tax=Mycolicibacterium sp. 018/SC-01/001 TaxID=2592069 RepID=UPI00163D881D|nr:helix-turn-helix transcriptional regulator [Mycolicibacterium sp. 018/SC-01/001]